jgi:hypothetical protein
MSDIVPGLSILLLVLSPLYIPVAVTIAGAIANWRKALRTRSRIATTASHLLAAGEEPQPLPDSRYPKAITPRPHRDPLPAKSDTEAA